MTLHQYMIDAFTDEVFHGNQAAVCATNTPLSEALMQAITCENNFSETAFLVPLGRRGSEGARYGLRWFTPGGEIDLCGHATLASAFAVNRFLAPGAAPIVFETCSGEIPVAVDGDWLTMDMPAYHLRPVSVDDAMERALGVRPIEAWIDRDLICLLPSEQDVRECAPNMDALKGLDGLGCCITSAADDAGTDFVSRFFAPKLGVPEDPVCGSAHCALAPLWADRLGKNELLAEQVSKRGGRLRCEVHGDRVIVAGKAALYAMAELHV